MDVLDKDWSSSPFLIPEPTLSDALCDGKFKVKNWLKGRNPL
jgi:hypothetical protein